MRYVLPLLLLLASCATPGGLTVCEARPDACDRFPAVWMEHEGTPAPDVSRLLYREISWPQIPTYCGWNFDPDAPDPWRPLRTRCGCATWDSGDILAPMTWWVVIVDDVANPDDVVIHELYHHALRKARPDVDWRDHDAFPPDVVGSCRIREDNTRPEAP